LDVTAEHIHELSKCAHISNHPNPDPFEIIPISSVVFTQTPCRLSSNVSPFVMMPSVTAEEEEEEEEEKSPRYRLPADTSIDSTASCAAVYRCHLRLAEPSYFCKLHLMIALTQYKKAAAAPF
jgi:hypothetical protein